jgi:hypothetical protein
VRAFRTTGYLVVLQKILWLSQLGPKTMKIC